MKPKFRAEKALDTSKQWKGHEILPRANEQALASIRVHSSNKCLSFRTVRELLSAAVPPSPGLTQFSRCAPISPAPNASLTSFAHHPKEKRKEKMARGSYKTILLTSRPGHALTCDIPSTRTNLSPQTSHTKKTRRINRIFRNSCGRSEINTV